MTSLLANKNQLHSQIDALNNIRSSTSQGLDECQSRLASTELQLESANAELSKIRASFTVLESEHISTKASLSEAKSKLTVVSGDRELLREAHAQDRVENGQLRERVKFSKKSIAALRER